MSDDDRLEGDHFEVNEPMVDYHNYYKGNCFLIDFRGVEVVVLGAIRSTGTSSIKDYCEAPEVSS